MRPWLLVAGDFTPFGGMDAANHALARYLGARRDVHLVAHRVAPDVASLPGVRVHRVRRPLGSHALGGALLSRVGRRVGRSLASKNVLALVNGGNCPIRAPNWIHYLHAAYEPEPVGSFARRSKASILRARDLAAERLALERAPIVICNSRRTRDEVVERFGISGSRVHAVYYGTDPLAFSAVAAARRADAKEALGMSRDRPLVGFVGALGDRRKAFDTVFRAWQRLCRGSSWDADLLVVGSGAEQPAWRQRAEETGLMARIRFVGYRYDVPDILAAVDALVHPARYEAYGLSVQEALCRGVPALVSARSGVAERYPSELKDLLILDPNDAGEVAERLTLWRAQIESFPPLVVPFSNHLRSRTWEAMAAEIASLVEDAAPA